MTPSYRIVFHIVTLFLKENKRSVIHNTLLITCELEGGMYATLCVMRTIDVNIVIHREFCRKI